MIGLVVIAILAVLLIFYAIRYVPAAISRLTGAVYLSSDNATTTATTTVVTEGTAVATLAPEVEEETVLPTPTRNDDENTPELPDE